jgi:hypothetical protein
MWRGRFFQVQRRLFGLLDAALFVRTGAVSK